MSTPHERAIKELIRRLRTELGNKLHSIVLYGSVARKEATEDSDIDILLVGESSSLYERISDISYDIDLKNGVLTAIFYTTPAELMRYVERGSPFIGSIAQEAVILYDDGTFERIRERLAKAGRPIVAGR